MEDEARDIIACLLAYIRPGQTAGSDQAVKRAFEYLRNASGVKTFTPIPKEE